MKKIYLYEDIDSVTISMGFDDEDKIYLNNVYYIDIKRNHCSKLEAHFYNENGDSIGQTICKEADKFITYLDDEATLTCSAEKIAEKTKVLVLTIHELIDFMKRTVL